ncbi:MAG: hypothetical protein WBN28_00520 [Lutimonas sp.]|jgi:hypothetical protein
MKIRNFNIIKGLLILMFISASCGESDELQLIEPDHRVVYTSEMDFDNTVEVFNSITFGDVSAGVVERTWTFPEGVVDIVGSEVDVTSKEDIVKAIFNVAGDHEVKLNQVYKGNVYVGDKQLNTKVVDTTIVVRVLTPISAEIKAYFINKDGSLGAELNLADDAKNEVTASGSVRFMHSHVGEPTNIFWDFKGGDPATLNVPDEEVDVKYKRMGIYDLQYIASRARPYGGDTISFKNLINVIPSTEPVDLEKVTDRNGKIALVYSREMDPTTINPNDFKIVLEHDGQMLSGNISETGVDPNEGNIVLLTLDSGLFNDDKVTISYVPGNLATLDLVKADAITDQKLEFDTFNILPDTSFDYSIEKSDISQWPYLWWGGVWGEFEHSISSANTFHGSKSLFINFKPQGGMILGHKDNLGNDALVQLKGGRTYELGMWIYVTEPFFTPGSYPLSSDVFLSDVRFYPTNWAFEAIPVTFNEEFPVGEWVYSSGYFTPAADMEVGFFIRGYNGGSDKNLKFYMDKISIAEVKLRP